jgi:hypothetical protein
MDKWAFIKLKSFCTMKGIGSKLKRLHTGWKKIFASCTSYKGLINRAYRELKILNSLTINEPIKKWATELNRTFSKKNSNGQKTYGKIFTISNHKGNANQNHAKILSHPCYNCHHQKHHHQQMLARMWGKRNPHNCWWESKLVQQLWKKIRRLLKNLNIDLPYDPAIPLLEIYPKE